MRDGFKENENLKSKTPTGMRPDMLPMVELNIFYRGKTVPWENLVSSQLKLD